MTLAGIQRSLCQHLLVQLTSECFAQEAYLTFAPWLFSLKQEKPGAFLEGMLEA